jgi:hypothetical protein
MPDCPSWTAAGRPPLACQDGRAIRNNTFSYSKEDFGFHDSTIPRFHAWDIHAHCIYFGRPTTYHAGSSSGSEVAPDALEKRLRNAGKGSKKAASATEARSPGSARKAASPSSGTGTVARSDRDIAEDDDNASFPPPDSDDGFGQNAPDPMESSSVATMRR